MDPALFQKVGVQPNNLGERLGHNAIRCLICYRLAQEFNHLQIVSKCLGDVADKIYIAVCKNIRFDGLDAAHWKE